MEDTSGAISGRLAVSESFWKRSVSGGLRLCDDAAPVLTTDFLAGGPWGCVSNKWTQNSFLLTTSGPCIYIPGQLQKKRAVGRRPLSGSRETFCPRRPCHS